MSLDFMSLDFMSLLDDVLPEPAFMSLDGDVEVLPLVLGAADGAGAVLVSVPVLDGELPLLSAPVLAPAPDDAPPAAPLPDPVPAP